ncbi:hypothetical protein D3C80_933240 [compost metagenome]|jgi:hypothetical protein
MKQMITEDQEYSEEFAKLILESENEEAVELDDQALDQLLEDMLVEAQSGNGKA